MNFKELKEEVCFNTYDLGKYGSRAGQLINQASREVGRLTNWGYLRVEYPASQVGIALTIVNFPDRGWNVFKSFEAKVDGGFVPVTITGKIGEYDRVPNDSSYRGLSAKVTKGPINVSDPTGQHPPVLYLDDPDNWVGVESVRASGLIYPMAMKNDDDISELGLDCDYALIAFARARLAIREDDADTRTAWMQEYQTEIMRLQMALVTDGVMTVEGDQTSPGTYWG